ncbi:hypothetical protein RHGRI_012633 [Rhododendron griersonianum]|uniref:Peptidase C1A papain C-terminal domain-containing protein n=1 Tax=Rhododendron griersonianum TaxID=479676 RepID=A0AAV6KSA9_9ERIC|nr:hypothetical protein RHGRI_012633 [Rhododendron griersonianum]
METIEMENNGFAHPLEILPPPINQGLIGSCSAVATVQCLSATLQMMLGGLQDPARRASVQELIDKIQEAFANDCYRAVPGEGGFCGFPPEIAFEYIKQYGVAVEANHPYCGQRTSTPTPPDSPRIWIQGFTVKRIMLPGTDSPDFVIQPIIRPIILQQLVVGVLRAPESLEQHREGVYQGAKDVDDAKTAGGHAVVVFGYGTENGQDYYWIQNTWGPEWGDNGIGKVSAHLFIYFVYPDLEGITIQEPGEGSA